MVKIKKKPAPVNVERLLTMIEESGVTYYAIEKDLKIGKGIVSRGVKEGTDRPIPVKWEAPIIKYLKKKIAEKQDNDIITQEILLDAGFSVPEKESNLKEELKEFKRDWLGRLQD